MKNTFLLAISLLMCVASIAQEQSSFVRVPAISPDGKSLAFAYQGDIWSSTIDGKNCRRITIHEAYDSNPIWSPDGSQIAFTSNRYGNSDIFIINAQGGNPKRLTYHSSGDGLTDWTLNNNLLFQSSRTFREVERLSEIHSISIEGGSPSRVLDALGSEASMSPDGKFIVFVRGGCRVVREQYKGSANRDIWLYNTTDKSYSQLTSYDGQDYNPRWAGPNKIMFLSARSGRYNIHAIEIDANGKEVGRMAQITNSTDEGITYFNVSAKNRMLVYQKGVSIYSASIEGEGTKKINLSIETDYRFDPYETKSHSGEINEYAVSPNGKYRAFIIHGEVFVAENDKKKSLTKNISKSAAREKHVTWLNDSVVIYSSDRDGQYDLYLSKSADKKESNLFKTLKREEVKLTKSEIDEHSAQISPDGEKISFIRGGRFGEMEFIIASINDAGKISSEKTLQKGWSKPSGVKWSPDSKWLAFSMQDLNFNNEVYIQAADGSGNAANISMHPRGDYSPVWSRDGSKLGFISDRNNGDSDVWFVWLNKEDYQKTKKDWDEEDEPKEEAKKGKDKDDKKKEDKTKAVEIDFDLIHERLVQVTSLDGDEGNLAISKDGKTFYFNSTAPGKKGSDLYQVKWDKTEMKEVTKGGKSPRSTRLSKNGKFLYMLVKGKVNRIAASGKELESLPHSAKMKINFNEELNQVFEEGWRSLRDGFYDPEFHGQDWDNLKSTYKPYCMSASTKTDFYYMYNMMLGQLNASHMGIYGKDREKTQSEKTGLLGIEFNALKNGVEVTKVVANSPADKEVSKLSEGDVILNINGEDVNDETNFWSLLTGTAGNKTLLSVKNKKGEAREVVIRPTSNLSSALYDQWVKERRRLTEEYSDGKLGYLHIRGMNMQSFERFERELTAAGHGKEAIVIDVRYNGGGWTTDYLMAILNVKQHAYTIPRGATNSLSNKLEYRNYYPFAERLPFFAWNKPSIALCNESSYSNAEIFSHAYKNLGIGTLVGKPTFGAVISTSGVGLLDGSFVRMPFRAWFVKADDKNMETDPAVPNIDVNNSPDYKSKGVDEQLKRAVDELLNQLEK